MAVSRREPGGNFDILFTKAGLMGSPFRNTLVVFAVCTGVGVAWQSGLAAVGLKDADVPEIAKSYFLNGDSGVLPGLYSLSGPMRTLWKSKGPAQRAQEVRDLAAYAKKYVSAPAFEKMYTEWIKRPIMPWITV